MEKYMNRAFIGESHCEGHRDGSHLASICFTVPVIWFIFSSKREMVSLFCLELASELCRGNIMFEQMCLPTSVCRSRALSDLFRLSPQLKEGCCSLHTNVLLHPLWGSLPHLCLVEKLLVDGAEVFELLPKLHQGILLLTDVLLQHLHGHLHLLLHPNLHLQFLLHILRRLNIETGTNYFGGILST